MVMQYEGTTNKDSNTAMWRHSKGRVEVQVIPSPHNKFFFT